MANFDDLFTAPTATETQSDRPQLTKEEYAAKKKAERDSLYALTEKPFGAFWMCRHDLTAIRPQTRC